MRRCGALAVGFLATMGVLCVAPTPAASQSPQVTILEQARSEAAAGHFDRASELYGTVLRAEPDNTVALAGYADAQVATGHWRDAMPFLKRLVQLEPRNAARIFQLGQMESWQPSQRAQALQLLERAAALDPSDAQYQDGYAEVLSWDAASRPRAESILRGVVRAHPEDVAARRQLAGILSWGGRSSEALAIAQSLARRPNAEAEDFWTLGRVEQALHLNTAAASAYRQALVLDPNHLKSIGSLAEMLSWNDATRPEAEKLFARGLRLSPDDEDLMLPYADMLSWNKSTRPRARELYEKVLAEDPNNPRALVGKAQLLAWSGYAPRGLDIVLQILLRDPNNAYALRVEAEIYDQRGDHARAANLLEQAHGLAPDDTQTMLDLSRADYEMGRYGDARLALAQVKGIDTPDYRELKRKIDHALGAYVEFGYSMRRDGKHLNYDAADAIVSTPLGTANRLSLVYQPLQYQTQIRKFNSSYYAVMLDSQFAGRVTTHAEAAARTYPGTNTQIEGAFDAKFSVRPSFDLKTNFERQADQESLTSTLGAESDGVFVGQVETNLGSIEGDYSNSKHHYDASLTYTDGVYTGQNIASNRRWSVDGNLGKSLHGDHPYVRMAYGFTYLSFAEDEDFDVGSGASPRFTGGYYSPSRFLLNYGQILVSTDLGRWAKWDAGGFLGAQNAETRFSSFSNAQLASTFSTHLTWSVTGHNDLRLGYDYLNVFNAFHRHLFVVSWRQYF